MDNINLDFEENLILSIKGQKVTVVAFKTTEPGNIKFGINAPFNLSVNRQEIYEQKKRNGTDNNLAQK